MTVRRVNIGHVKGDTGNGILDIKRSSGNGAAGTKDTYTITYTDGTFTTFDVWNGMDGKGATIFTDIQDGLVPKYGDLKDMVLTIDGWMPQPDWGNKTTTFETDGSITEQGETSKVTTIFNADGSITEKLFINDEHKLTRTTTFEGDNISVTVTKEGETE